MTNAGAERALIAQERGYVAGMSPAIQTIERAIAEIAPTNIPILLTGESGTGKEMFAHRVHQLSCQSGEPLLRVACASMNSATFAAELGLANKAGKENHQKLCGTVVFEEISELDANCQRSLLYALPDGEATNGRATLTARVVSTTSRNLEHEMRAGRFRSDLFYRINGVCLPLPALRDRREDVPLLVEHFLTKFAEQLGKPRPSLSPRTLRIFLDHPWPGNIRQLENVVKNIVVLGDDGLAVAELKEASAEPASSSDREGRAYSLKAAARAASRQAERELILEALERNRWNRKRAALELQISYKSLLYKLKQIGLAGDEAN